MPEVVKRGYFERINGHQCDRGVDKSKSRNTIVFLYIIYINHLTLIIKHINKSKQSHTISMYEAIKTG